MSLEETVRGAGPPDAELIARSRQGDPSAFEALVTRYEPLVLGYTRHLLEGEPEAEDVAQEAFLKAYRELQGLRDSDKFLPWLKSIAWRECRAWVRRKKTERSVLREVQGFSSRSGLGLPTEPWDEEPSDADPWLERLEAAIESMSEGKRAVLTLFYLEEFPQEQIAEFLEIPVGTVKRRLFEGRQAVAAAAEASPPEDLSERKRFVHAVKRMLAQPKTDPPKAPASMPGPEASKIRKEPAMRIAVLSCIHGNLPALQAVAKEIDAAKPDKVYCLGDVIDYGAEPRECIKLVRERGWPVLLGNHEAMVQDPTMLEQFNPTARNCGYFTLGALGPDDREWIKSLPLTHHEDGIFFAHASPVKGKEYLQYLLSAEDIQTAFGATPCALTFVAHTHVPMALYDEQPLKVSKDSVQTIDPKVKAIINVGSVGQPRDRDPRACWVLYDSGKKQIEYRRTPYDTQEACRRIKSAGLPEKIGDRLLTAV